MIFAKKPCFWRCVVEFIADDLGCAKILSVYLTLGQCGEYVADSFLVIASLVSFLSRHFV